jgi:2',3'-cyclic-nucleotide 2'-phosphodiesterase (5'-nucleotidase family)
MKIFRSFSWLFAATFLVTCQTPRPTAAGDDGVIELVFLQMNDVYEISPSAGDNLGGLARVAGLRRELLAKNPNTFTVLSGDFISPSVIGTLRHEGKRIRGKQMVEALNTLGLDWVVFGNHEFDYDLEDLQARLNESKFTWMAANARLKTAAGLEPFFKESAGGGRVACPDHVVREVKDADGTTVNLGLFGVLINTGRKPWVEYTDWTEAARKNLALLKPKSDVIVALTHLDIDDDVTLAKSLPEVPLFMGGHDHDNMIKHVGPTVAKADANARTVYVHTLRYDKKTRKSQLKSELRRITADLPVDPATAAVVEKWEKIKDDALKTAGFNPSQKVTALAQPLDARDAFTRYQQAPVGARITEAMLAVAKQKPELALLNSGSIRVDDVLSGTLTELDVVRMLPFGGSIQEVEMRGSLLRRVLDTGEQNRGTGGYLQLNGASRNAAGQWLVGAQPLDDQRIYRVVLPDFLLTGNEVNLAFLKTEPAASGAGTTNPDVVALYRPDPKNKTDLRNDIRQALIRHLRGE